MLEFVSKSVEGVTEDVSLKITATTTKKNAWSGFNLIINFPISRWSHSFIHWNLFNSSPQKNRNYRDRGREIERDSNDGDKRAIPTSGSDFFVFCFIDSIRFHCDDDWVSFFGSQDMTFHEIFFLCYPVVERRRTESESRKILNGLVNCISSAFISDTEDSKYHPIGSFLDGYSLISNINGKQFHSSRGHMYDWNKRLCLL